MTPSHLAWLAAFLLAFALAGTTPAADPRPAQTLVVSVGQTVRLQMRTKKPIKTAVNDREDVIRLTPVRDDPTTILVTGLALGVARVTLTSADGDREVWETGRKPGKP
jgi:hypothetical protein